MNVIILKEMVLEKSSTDVLGICKGQLATLLHYIMNVSSYYYRALRTLFNFLTIFLFILFNLRLFGQICY